MLKEEKFMSECYFVLNKEDYSWKNALLWGNFTEHCKQISQGSLGHRTIHTLTAAGEFLPLLGQVFSIFEKIIITNFFNPPSKIPQLGQIVNMVNPAIGEMIAKESDEEMNRLFLENVKKELNLCFDISSKIEKFISYLKYYASHQDSHSIQAILSDEELVNMVTQVIRQNSSHSTLKAKWTGYLEASLVHAVQKGHIDVLKALLSNKSFSASVSYETVQRMLRNAIYLGNIEIAQTIIEAAKEISKNWKIENLNYLMCCILSKYIGDDISNFRKPKYATISEFPTFIKKEQSTNFSSKVNFILNNPCLRELLDGKLGDAIFISLDSKNEYIVKNICKLLSDSDNVEKFSLIQSIAILKKAVSHPNTMILETLLSNQLFKQKVAPFIGEPIFNLLKSSNKDTLPIIATNITKILSCHEILNKMDKKIYGEIFLWAANNGQIDIVKSFEPSISIFPKNSEEKREATPSQEGMEEISSSKVELDEKLEEDHE
jgi:hypothetical protein